MKFKAEEIALYLKGEVVGDPECYVGSVSKIEEGKRGYPCISCESEI
jgi:hypothetical protein